MSKYRTDIGDERRLNHGALPRSAARGLDGRGRPRGPDRPPGHFNMPIEGVCPKMDRKSGEVVNAGLITVPDRGYQPRFNNGTKGWERRRAATASITSPSGTTSACRSPTASSQCMFLRARPPCTCLMTFAATSVRSAKVSASASGSHPLMRPSPADRCVRRCVEPASWTTCMRSATGTSSRVISVLSSATTRAVRSRDIRTGT
jgi:hypothetical protein